MRRRKRRWIKVGEKEDDKEEKEESARVDNARAAAGHHCPDAPVAIDHRELQRRAAAVAVELRDRRLLRAHKQQLHHRTALIPA